MERTKVFMLMAGLTALLVVIGGAVGGTNGMMIFFIMAALMNFGMYWFSDKVVLRMYGAQIVTEQEAPELYRMVDRLRQRADLPMPILAIAPSQQPNAFATGRNPEHAVVCCTQGILKLINNEQLEAVIAHELGHIKLRHMLVGTVAATMAGAISMVGRILHSLRARRLLVEPQRVRATARARHARPHARRKPKEYRRVSSARSRKN